MARNFLGWLSNYCFVNAIPYCTVTYLFLKSRFIAQSVYTVCSRINDRIVPLTNFNKYLYYGTSGPKEYICINIGANNGSEKL
jgi:hypothetical protein